MANTAPATKRGAARNRARAALALPTETRCAVYYEGPVPFGPAMQVQQYRLENGLRLLLLVDNSAPVVAYHTWFRVGSRHERDGKTGLAHLLEHLMFVEFEGLKANEFDRRMEQAGAETNAATWVDWTYYYEQAPADQLGLLISLEAIRMGKLALKPDTVQSELEVVANERRYRVDDDVEGSVSEQLYSMAFRQHGYRTPTIGWMRDIQALSLDDVAAFYRTYYAPNNATVVVAGSFDELRTVQKIATAYAYLGPSELPVEDAHPEPPQTSERVAVVQKPTSTHKLSLGYHGPSIADADHVALSLMHDVLFGGRSSRVHRALVQEAEIATDVRGWLAPFQAPGLSEIQLTARPGHTAEQLLEALDVQLEAVLREPVTAQELDRAKARAELGLVRSLESCGGKAEQIAFYDTLLADPAGAFRRLEHIRRLSRADVLWAARRYLQPSTRSVILVHPQEEVSA